MRITHCHGKPGHSSKSLRRVSCVVPKQPFFLGTTAKKSWAVVASEKTDTTGCLLARLRHGAVRKDRHEQRMLMRHRDVRKDKHERRQFRRPESAFGAVRKDKHGKAWRKARYQMPDKTAAGHLEHQCFFAVHSNNLVISSCRFNACVRRRKQASQSASTKCLPVAWESKGTKASPLSSRLPWNCGNHRGNPTVSTRSAVVPSGATRPRSSRRLSCWKMNPPGG